jgi:hypothetical protein
MNNVMIDLETLGTGTNCVVLSIGAVKFDSNEVDPLNSLHHFFDVQQQIDEGRDIDAATFAWWMGQDSAARRPFTEGARTQLSVGTILHAFDGFFQNADYIWSHGANFDVPILEQMYKSRKRPTPWKYANVRDTRTVFGLLNQRDHEMMKAILKPAGVTAHDAQVDANRQAAAVQFALKCLHYES